MNRISCIALLLLGSCQGYSSYDYLDGKFIAKDLTPVDLLAPSDKSTSLSRNPKFTWSKRSGVAKYLIELSTQSDFSVLTLSKTLADASYTLVNSDLTGLSALDASSYYWRVTAQYNDQKVSSGSFIFHVLDDMIVYVNGGSKAAEQVGNKTSPFKKIQSAIEAAETMRDGLAATNLNIYVAAGIYNEEVHIKPGISLRGGFAADNWNREISTYASTIASPTDSSIKGNATITSIFTGTTIIEGFTILAGSNGSPAYAVDLTNSSPTILKNTFSIGAHNGSITLINATNSSPLISENNITTAGTSITNYGISITNPQNIIITPIITKNTISGSSLNGGSCIYTDGTGGSSSSFILIADNIISPGAGTGVAATGISMTYGNNSIIRNNVIFSGLSTAGNFGISLTQGAPLISNNTISGGGNSTARGIHMSGAALPTITNNVIFTTGGTTRYCVFEGVTGADPKSFQNNLLFDCPTALYVDEGSSNRVLEADLNTAANTTQGGAATAAGNLGPASVANFAAVNFTSASDFHLTNASPLNVRCGGKDTSIATCGSGGVSSCGSVTTDLDSILRTASLMGTCVGASNTGAAGYSIGAYEKD